jgi:hypothetical protein
MKPIPPSYSAPGSVQADPHERSANHPAADEDWLAALLQKQVGMDESADQGFSAALMQTLPPQAELARQLAPVVPGRLPVSVLPSWLAIGLPWLGLYGLVVTAATMLWLALTQVVLPGAGWPPLFDFGMTGSLAALVNLLATSLAPAVILGWLAWWLHEQDWLVG